MHPKTPLSDRWIEAKADDSLAFFFAELEKYVE
jgi:hypothetical protein